MVSAVPRPINTLSSLETEIHVASSMYFRAFYMKFLLILFFYSTSYRFDNALRNDPSHVSCEEC